MATPCKRNPTSTSTPTELTAIPIMLFLRYEHPEALPGVLLMADGVLDGHWLRAMGVQRSLADVSRHRSDGLTDLQVAAVAEQHRLTVLHYDSDHDTISELTGVKALWVVERTCY